MTIRSDLEQQLEEVVLYLSKPNLPASQAGAFTIQLNELQSKLEELSHG